MIQCLPSFFSVIAKSTLKYLHTATPWRLPSSCNRKKPFPISLTYLHTYIFPCFALVSLLVRVSLALLQNRLAFSWMLGSLVTREKTGAVVERHYFCLTIRRNQSWKHWHGSPLFPPFFLFTRHTHTFLAAKLEEQLTISILFWIEIWLKFLLSLLTTREKKIGLLFRATYNCILWPRFQTLTFSSFTPCVVGRTCTQRGDHHDHYTTQRASTSFFWRIRREGKK